MNALAELATEVPFRRYTQSGVFRTKLSASQITLLETAGHGGIIRAAGGISWTSLRSMCDKGAAVVLEREVRHLSNGKAIQGRILAVRVK